MAIDIKLDLIGNLELPTIILANRNGNKLGQLNVDNDSVDFVRRLNDASELSFKIHKEHLILSREEEALYNEFLKSSDNYILTDSDGLSLISKDSKGFIVSKEVFNAYLWDKITDFKLVYFKELDMWFEIKAEIDESDETIKTVFGTQLGQAELSQIMLYNIEINTEADIERDDYKIAILYDAYDPEASILNRLLKDKAPHYSIAYVSPTIAKIQRSFSFDGTSILDALQEIAEEIGCLFRFEAGIENGVLRRKIAVHDLQQNCNDCGYRGEFTDKCPKCGSTNIKNGYGEDTLIFVTSDELASEGIQLVTDVDSVKNCFKLEAGDDLMTAAVRSCNPNGTDYIWYFSDALKEDMPLELVERLESYDELYRAKYNDGISSVKSDLLTKYNSLVNKYSSYNEDLQSVETPIVGYSNLMNAYYNTIDLALYLQSGLMPSVEMSETNAREQIGLLTASSLSPVAVANLNIVSLSTANTAVLAMAKTIVKSTYKLEIKSSELYEENGSKYWRGNFIATNYSDDEDTAEGNLVYVRLNDDLETATKQKIEKVLNKGNTDDLSVSGLFEREYNDFCAELHKYALNPLTSIYEACQSCIDILIDQGVGNNEGWSDNEEGSDGNLYEKLYLPYYNKLKAIEVEIEDRENEINIILGVYDNDGNLIVDGLQPNIEECIRQIQDSLNFEEYLGERLWLDFCAYRREDKYSNSNYISDGLDNAELFKRAQEFFKVAENEIYKSAELQHSISASLNNLLLIPKFKSLVESFDVGNWIRVQIDNKIYKLRLLEYGIKFGDLKNISVEFSDVSKVKNGITDVRSVLSQASSMATSYSSVQRQANKGDRAKTTIEQWLEEGLNSANVQIQSNDSEDITITKNGILCRSYDDITDTHSPEQFRITHNIMAYTDDEWKTVRQAIGKHDYKYFDKDFDKLVDKTGYGMNADFVTAGVVSGSQIIGGDIYSDNYSQVKGTGSYLNLRTGDFSFGGGALRFDSDSKKLYIGSDASDTNITEINEEWLKTTNVYAENLRVKAAHVDGDITAKGILIQDVNGRELLSAANNKVTIAGWNVAYNGLWKSGTDGQIRLIPAGNLTTNYTVNDFSTKEWVILCGKDNTYSCNFGVTKKGSLYASDVNLTGHIKATSGEIGGCEIVNNKLTIDAARITSGEFDEARIPKLSTDKIDVADIITVGSIATTNDIPKVPTKVSELENDRSYLTNDTLAVANVLAKNLQVYAANIENTLTAEQINADGIEAENVNITGTINSIEGSIGGFDIKDGRIQSEDYVEGDDNIVVWDESEYEDYPEGLTYTILSDGTYEVTVKVDDRNLLPANLVIPSIYEGVAVTSIGNGAFVECNNLVSVSIPDTITTIGQRAFSRCTNLQNVKLSNSITSISRAAFYGCSSLQSIVIPDSVITIETLAFEGASLKNGIVIPDSVVTIGDIAFTCSRTPFVILGSSVRSIGAGAFGENSLLKSVYYHGSYGDWKNISINMTTVSGYYNDSDNINFVNNATKYYYSETNPNSSGNFWHYKDTTGVRVSCDDMLIDSRYFKVFSDGQVIAENAIIKGNIVASSLKATNSFSIGQDNNAEHYITTAQTQDGGFYVACKKVGSSAAYGGYMRADKDGLLIGCANGTGRFIGTWDASASISTNSDISLKNNIEPLDDRYTMLFDSLRPVRYKYNDGTSDRFHTGFIAQSVEESILSSGLSTQDFAAFIRGENNCSLRYEEFIALCVEQIQKLKLRVEELERNASVNSDVDSNIEPQM
jgi:hypothetical protein